jgi:hypothetical protein
MYSLICLSSNPLKNQAHCECLSSVKIVVTLHFECRKYIYFIFSTESKVHQLDHLTTVLN